MNTAHENQFADLSEEVQLAATINLDAPTAPEPLSAEPLPTGFVASTTDYDKFKTITANREVDQRHVAKLVEAIRHRNWLHIKPININQNFEVIDGQHRLDAARVLGVPIYYQITEALTEEDIAILNANSKNWKGTDYLNYWTVKGKPAYIELSRFLNLYPKFSLSTAQELVSGNDSAKHTEFRDGRFEGGHFDSAVDVAKFIAQITEATGFQYAYDTRFARAINHCVLYVDGFEQKVFLRKIELQPIELRRQATHRQYLDLFESLYNYRTAEINRVKFR